MMRAALRIPRAIPMETTMPTRNMNPRLTTGEWMAWLLVLVASALYAVTAIAAAPAQKTFATPEDAAAAVVQAVKANDKAGLRAILGNDQGDLSSGDPVADRANAESFVARYDRKHALVASGDAMTLTIGEDDFPFAFPLVKVGDRWRFDTVAGKDELLARRIGANELDAIRVLGAIVDAQLEYASADRDGDGVPAYARKFLSTPGKHDGLYWPTQSGEPPSPLGPFVAQASGEGYKAKQGTPSPYHGYYYRLLKGQGKGTDTPAFDYVVHGRAIGGFAVVAYPARYGNSGIMTFIVNQDGKVYQSDLGRETAKKAAGMQVYAPGPGWSAVADK
jgi:hypothetical protein